MITAGQARHVMLHGWSGLLTLAIALLGVATIFISPLRELLGPLWTGYPAIAFGYIFLGAPKSRSRRLSLVAAWLSGLSCPSIPRRIRS